ncbi:hypothetical protein QCA50_011336 [Cerrena zonata]|uniref:Uncharacterized protein n=1 Tax=Cerrena zonata TaxID=2478898 RepID=A0AAW0G1U7_9APHY
MEPTIENVDFMFNGPPSLVRPFVTKLLVKLHKPNVPDVFALCYFRHMKVNWEHDTYRLHQRGGWTRVQQIFVDCGIIETLLHYTQHESSTQDRDLAGYHALDCIQHFILAGSTAERCQLFEQLMAHNFLGVCIDKIDNSPLIVHRGAAANCLRFCINHCPLAKSLSAARTAEALEKFCQWTILGSDRDAEELQRPDKIWQTQLLSGQLMLPRYATKYARRISGMKAEHYMFGSHALLCRSPPPSREFILDVVTHRPNIFDLFFECGLTPRPPWYPETDVDSAAIEILALLMQFPLTTIPCLDIPLEGNHKDEYKSDVDTSIKIIQVFVSRPNWAQRLIDVWSKYEHEEIAIVERLLSRVSQDWYAAAPPEDDAIVEVMERRGTIRIATLRIIANATYANEIKDSDLLSLARIAYLACQKVKSQEEVMISADPDDICVWQERNQEILRVPLAGTDREDVDEVALIPREATIGPIALIRVLTCLAERGLLDQSQSWTQLPEGTSPSVTLANLKQITSPPIIKKILTIAVKRASAYREIGRQRVQSNAYHRALLAYVPAAELSCCLLEFDRVTGRKYSREIRGARKELVLCLGNAAEMSRRKDRKEDFLRFAVAANQYAKDALPEEGITGDLIVKNGRRLAEAKRVLNVS